MSDRSRARRRRRFHGRRRAAGWIWFLGWVAVLWAFESPWRRLGGLECERVRWLAGCALWGGLFAGLGIGHEARLAAEHGSWVTHRFVVRAFLVPTGAIVALAFVLFEWLGAGGPIGVGSNLYFAFWAGIDMCIGAFPLMHGRAYAFGKGLDDSQTDWL